MPQHAALQARQTEAGARFTSVVGATAPESFGDADNEYEALRQHAGVLDLSFRALLMLRGSDASSFLNNMVTNEVASLQDGSGCDALKVSLQGKVEAALRVLKVGDDMWCDLEPGPREALVVALRKRIILADVVLSDESEHWALLSVQGPRASDVLASLDVDVQELQTPHAHVAATLAGVPARVVHSDHSGENGYDVFAATDNASTVWDALLDDSMTRPVGLAALNARRIEAGIPWAGREINGERLPQEVGFDDRWISYTKGCYLGQETVARLHHHGHVNRHLRGLVVEGDRCPEVGTALRAQEKDVGVITSVALSPRLRQPIALAYVRRAHADSGSRLEIGSGSTPMYGEVVALPML